MKKRDFNLYISVLAFITGALFVLSNDADITANVVGASGEGATLTAFIGILIIIGSAAFFVLTINHDMESLVRKNEHTHEDLTKEEKIQKELEEKYDYKKSDYNK
jgi:hypothetical protein